MIQLTIYQGKDFATVLQASNEDGSVPTAFLSTDTLTSSFWDGQNQPTIFSPAVQWFTGLLSITVDDGGSTYTASPTITISGGGASTDATARATVVSGIITAIVLTDPGDGYTSAPTVAITDGTGSAAAATAIPALGWQTGLVQINMDAAATLTLDPAGTYRLQVDVTRTDSETQTATIIDCLAKVIATPGSTTPSPPDLISLDFAETYCSVLGLTNAQIDILPYLVSAASMAIRRFCFDRNFDLRTYVEFQDVAINGQVRLYQVPVQVVQRVQGQPQLALTIQNASSSVQAAQAYFAYSGTWQGYGTNLQTPTGITLVSVSNGTSSSSTVSFTANETITALATAINLVGGGWTATANSTYGAWPVTELDGGYVGQGAILGSGAQFNVLTDLAPPEFSMDTRRMGLLFVGSGSGAGYNAGRWGPGGESLWGYPSNGYLGRVKVTYVAGEAVIPIQIQLACAELVKSQIIMTKIDPFLESETAQEYSYRQSLKMLAAIPQNVAQALSQYRIPRA